MEFYDELLYKELGRFLIENFEKTKFDYHTVIQTQALKALYEIQQTIQDETLEDFYVVEKIVCVLEKYGMNTGGRHDF